MKFKIYIVIKVNVYSILQSNGEVLTQYTFTMHIHEGMCKINVKHGYNLHVPVSSQQSNVPWAQDLDIVVSM